MTTGKTIALTRQNFVGKVMSLLFNMLFRLVTVFLPKSKRLLILWLQSPSAVILEPKKIVCHCILCFPIYLPCPKRWCCESITLNIPANLENSAVAIGLETVSFPSNPKERQCQRLLKLPHNFTHLTRQQSNAQNSPSQASTVCGPWTSRYWSWF